MKLIRNRQGSLYEVQFEIENKCALNCLHCSSILLRKSERQCVDFKEFICFLERLNSKIFLCVTGGEPLIHENICEKFYLCRKQLDGISLGMFTSGITQGLKPISLSFANRLKASGLDECYVSLFHSLPEYHDKVTGLSGSHALTLESIGNLMNVGVIVNVHTVINSFNYIELERIIADFLGMGINSVRVLRIVNAGSASENWNAIGLPDEVQNQIVLKLLDSVSKYKSKLTFSGFPERIACRPFNSALKCQAGINLLYVTANGDVYPCACTKNSRFLIGNVQDYDLMQKIDILYNDRLYHDKCLNTML